VFAFFFNNLHMHKSIDKMIPRQQHIVSNRFLSQYFGSHLHCEIRKITQMAKEKQMTAHCTNTMIKCFRSCAYFHQHRRIPSRHCLGDLEVLKLQSRSFSTSPYSFKGEKLRVAIVGGGCAGLSTALHLAPLVEQGWIAGPIDIYEEKPVVSRDIGVGIWSTALEPFRDSNRTSHRVVYQTMTTDGTWLGDVGYRTPDGAWLLKSKLPTNKKTMEERDMPALLFLRERDMLESLQEAVHWEEHQGTVRVLNAGRVDGLYEESSHPWSTNLTLSNAKIKSITTETTPTDQESEYTSQPQSCLTDRDYHLIVAADGMNSTLRSVYGGHETDIRRLIGTSTLASPIDLPTNFTDTKYMTTVRDWDKSQHNEIVGLQDRHYTVFRGNANISRKDLYNDPNNPSYQTWGTGKSMRFATVPMMCPTPQGREERQVWFMTIDNDALLNESDPVKRRDLLLEEFKDWHNPIQRTVMATPPDEILMERAVAHRHCTGPVLAFNTKVVRHLRGRHPPSSGEGPCIVFIGDSYMTVDPILAQGFTCAMESGAALSHSVSRSYLDFANSSINTARNEIDPQLAFDPIRLRQELKDRQASKMDRLICLLRVTELVQALGQPNAKWTGRLNTMLLRPLMRLVPNFIKAPIFDAVLKYSLGLGLTRKTKAL
jgi:2-polyprenyl-6-methoxyphenol hydroxylase-like FAD-dependent oxidoreductase